MVYVSNIQFFDLNFIPIQRGFKFVPTYFLECHCMCLRYSVKESKFVSVDIFSDDYLTKKLNVLTLFISGYI